ncbi:SAICAR synthase-like protein [Glarea lozoyensis ATCC 20868]|uniref:1-phosphatidylinositol-4-phosphate 5-kinase n=1 Tax=Glarea lozoyensis (strain ATCC 20868 / MF5171) TaxID=1116229 RepID=S3DVL9_GLAL2|nr:SAICAR synthase-like protein [Glarea lozoyensis ATCC 20868]EPE35996.1 SAICAR synthase-like protein [Glarea lozoyensis ATCC 20868]
MPHAVDMPSFLTGDTGPPVSASRSPYEVSHPSRNSHEKTNGNTKTLSYTSIRGGPGEVADMYMENAHSVLTNGRTFANGDMLQDGALNQVPNGRASGSSWDHKSSRNGSTLSVNGGTENGRRSPGPQNGMARTSNGTGDRNSIASTNGNGHHSNTQSATQTNGDSEPHKPDLVPSAISTSPQSTGPLTYTTSLLPATPVTPETPQRAATASPHRYSSPPAYPAPPIPSSANNNNANNPHPGTSQLKHRHTLQVPKVTPTRNSRDGDEAIHSSGRFSPTAVASSVRRGSLSLNRRNTQSIHSNMPHEEIPPDEDAIRWAEAVRQKRASKRRRKDEEDDDRVVVGTKVDQNHVNWVTAYNMLTGIRFTVSRTNAKLDRPLTDADFDAKHKFSFDITGNELTPSAKYDFKFKDYAPWVFRHLRAKFKLDPADYLMSLTSKYILSELGSPGKSGSFFYFSRDYKYIIKTIHHAEHKFLRKILKDYWKHIEDNPNTLLSQFYGLHRVKIPYGRKIHFVVMNNLFPPHRDIHQTFDLKGSTIGRDFKEEDLEKNPRATLKDLNWLRREKHLEFGPEKRTLFFEQMERDVHLLQRLKIMDYSMLVGVHDLQKGNQENLRDKTLQVFQPGGDAPTEDSGPDGRGLLMRTPSKLENARKARELRQIIKQEKPIPMGQSSSRMPDTLEENTTKRDFIFYSDDGGFQATHEDNSPGEEIFFLSIIDCLTHYGTVKKLEHFWKGLSQDKKQISPISPEPYGERFIQFIEGITKSPEEAAREKEAQATSPIPHTNSNTFSDRGRNPNSVDSGRRRSNSQPMHRSSNPNSTLQRNEQEAVNAERRGDDEAHRPDPRIISVVRSPSADRSGGLQGQTLPVVEELGEASSTGGRSGHSREENDDGDRRPRTPAKDYVDGRPLTPPKDYSPNGNGYGHGDVSKTTVNRSSLDKKLPPLPPVTSPVEKQEKDSFFSFRAFLVSGSLGL